MAAAFGCSTPNTFPALDDEYSFKGLRFETDSSVISGLVSEQWESVTDDVVPHEVYSFTYTRPSDTLQFLGHPVTRIAYTFYKGKLSCVFVTVKGDNNLDNIVKDLKKVYGPGEGIWGLADSERLWLGKKVEIDTRHYDGGLVNYYVPQKEIYTFTIASLVVRKNIQHDEKLISMANDSITSQ